MQPPIPKMVRIREKFDGTALDDVAAAVRKELDRDEVIARIRPGMTIALTAGSRGVANIALVIRETASFLKEHGAKPFVIPAMGSHGGAVAEGQRRILEGYGITEETMGVPIVSSMETVQIGETPHGLPVHMDKNAAAADFIVPVGRVKPHTDFRGRHESGLYKMLAIGCGKQHGADICHSRGYGEFSRNIAEIAEVMLQKKKILFGMAIVEDAFHGTYSLTAVPPERFEEEDARLLVKAKELIPHIPFEKVNVLVLNRFGKNRRKKGRAQAAAYCGVQPIHFRLSYTAYGSYTKSNSSAAAPYAPNKWDCSGYCLRHKKTITRNDCVSRRSRTYPCCICSDWEYSLHLGYPLFYAGLNRLHAFQISFSRLRRLLRQ